MAPRKTSSRKSGYTIGVTIFVNADGSLGLFENGLRQNVLFLYQMFANAPNCAKVYLLNHGDGEPASVPTNVGIDPAAIVRTPDVIDELDYVVVIGAAMDGETVKTLRKRGCKIIDYKGGNGAIISIEATICKPPRGDAERMFDADFYDAMWMTSQHLHTYRGWCETLFRCPVYEIPQVWSPLLIDNQPQVIRDAFGYKPKREKWRLGVMDPNITVMKTSHMPMLVCESAYRLRPNAFEAMYITNGLPHAEKLHFRLFYQSLTATKAGLMTLEQRFIASHFLANHCDAVITHQWENGLNYLYYEVLYGNYPLIHNSPFLKDYGYYFEDFDADSGAAALLKALDTHDENLEAYAKQTKSLIDRLNPTTPENIDLHEKLLLAC